MDSIEKLLQDLNDTENEFNNIFEQYSELQKIVLHDSHDVSTSQNDSPSTSSTKAHNRDVRRSDGEVKNKAIQKSNCQKGDSVKTSLSEQDNSNVKKLVKSRIKNYHSLVDNIGNYRCSNKEKNKFLENLGKSNESVLENEKNMSIVNKFMRDF